MENTVELTKEEIIEEVRRTGILCYHYFSPAADKFIWAYCDYDQRAVDILLKETHTIALLKLQLETPGKYPEDDLEIVNLVYESPVKILTVNDGYVELFANNSMLHHRKIRFPDPPNLAYPCFPDHYVDKNIEFVTAAHDNQYLNPKELTEADQNEIYIALLSRFRFHYESDLRTIRSIKKNTVGCDFLRTLTLKRPKLTSQNILHAAIGRLEMHYFSEYGARIVQHTAAQNQYTDPNQFLQIQSALHLLERRFLKHLKEPKRAEKSNSLKNDLLRIQAFKEASAEIDQIIFPKAEILVFSDQSVLFAPEEKEPESHLDIYQFIMVRLRDLQSMYFSYDRNIWKLNEVPVSGQFSKYGVDFSLVDGRVVTTFTRKFKDRLFNAANTQLT